MLKLNSIISFFAFLFVILIPIYDAPFVIRGGVPLAFAVFVVFILFYCLKKNISFPVLPTILFILFLGVYSFAYILNINVANEKSVNHIVFYFFSFLLYYLGFYFSIVSLGEEKIKKGVVFGLILLAVAGTLEILVFFVSGYHSYANFLNHGNNVGIFAGFFPRMRSLFNEPSHLAIFVIGMIPIVWTFSRLAKFLIIYLLFWTFSTSAAFGMLVAGFLYLLRKNALSKKIGYKLVLIGSVSVFVITFSWIKEHPLFSKLYYLFASDSTDSVRKNAVLNSLEYFELSPFFGNGPAFYYTYSDFGLFNLYLQLFIESGFIGLLFFLLFLFLFYHNRSMSTSYRFIPFYALVFQYVGMNHYYIPGLWMMLAYLYYSSSNLNKKLSTKYAVQK